MYEEIIFFLFNRLPDEQAPDIIPYRLHNPVFSGFQIYPMTMKQAI
jgi:hypothetical protein